MAKSTIEAADRNEAVERARREAEWCFESRYALGLLRKPPEAIKESFLNRFEASRAIDRVLALGAEIIDRVIFALVRTYDDRAIPEDPKAPRPHWRGPHGIEEQAEGLEREAATLRSAAEVYLSDRRPGFNWLAFLKPVEGRIAERDGLRGNFATRQEIAEQLQKDAIRCELMAVELRLQCMHLDYDIDGPPGTKKVPAWDTPALLALAWALHGTPKRWPIIEGLMTDFFDSRSTAVELKSREYKAMKREKDPDGTRLAYYQKREDLFRKRDRLRESLGLGTLPCEAPDPK
jgi:hypothetical protein